MRISTLRGQMNAADCRPTEQNKEAMKGLLAYQLAVSWAQLLPW